MTTIRLQVPDQAGHWHSEDSSEHSELLSVTEDKPTDNALARTLWNDLLHNKTLKDNELTQALNSIRILDQQHAPQNKKWLKEVLQGQLHPLPQEFLQQVAQQAPPQFTAQVADFNDNLWYDWQSPNSTLDLTPLQQLLQVDQVLGSFLMTQHTIPQPAHVDFTWKVLEDHCRPHNDKHTLQIGFFPLTQEGSFLQVWPRQDSGPVIPGQLIFVPYGYMLIAPASCIHAGGFRTTPSSQPIGNLRFHLYLSQPGSSLPTHQTNKYTEPLDPRRELCERYVDAPAMDVLLKHLFV